MNDSAIATFQQALRGRLVHPTDADYDAVRALYNGMIDKRPRLIARAVNAADVIAAVNFAREQGLLLAIRGGGHNGPGLGSCDDGLVIDLSMMKSVRVDHTSRTVRVDPGCTSGDVDHATHAFGLAVPFGIVSTTGVAGLTLGGGSGWFERKWGLACDALVSVELVTADGRLVIADETQNTELFWALHGGGGNFGVATSLTFRLQPLPTATLGLLLWPGEAGPQVLRAYRDLIEGGAPDELGGAAVYLTGPPEEFVPAHLQGKLLVGVAMVYAGTEADAREVFAPMFALAPEGVMVAEMPYDVVQSALDDPPGFRNYWSAEHLSAFPDAAVDAFCDRVRDMPSPSPSQQLIAPWGGQVLRAADTWPLPHRKSAWVVHPFGLWEDAADDARGIRWARDLCADLQEWATGYVYLNFIGNEGQSRVIAGFGEDNYRRLARVKCEYDPENVFHLNQNIEPAVSQ